MGGIPKGLESIGGVRILDRVAAALRAACDDLLIAANAPDASNWLPDVAVLADEVPGSGGLAGIHATLGRGRDALVVAWDMPFVAGDLLRELARQARVEGAEVVVPESDSPHGIEPFCAFYAQAVREPLGEYLRSGGGSAHRFLAGLPRVSRVPRSAVRRFGDPRRLFFSVNTPDDLAHARAMAGGGH